MGTLSFSKPLNINVNTHIHTHTFKFLFLTGQLSCVKPVVISVFIHFLLQFFFGGEITCDINNFLFCFYFYYAVYIFYCVVLKEACVGLTNSILIT